MPANTSQAIQRPPNFAAPAATAAPADAFVSSGSSPPLLGDHPLHPRFKLEHGDTLKHGQLAYSVAGPSEGPTVLVLGGISADRHVSQDPSGAPGWWAEFVGPGRSIDTRHIRVISIDYLGGRGGSSAPLPSLDTDSIPAITPRDQAVALMSLLEQLGVQRLDACIGASYGGMVGLALATLNSKLIRKLIVISAGDRAHPLATAWRLVQRKIVQFGDAFGSGTRGLALARELAMTTYRSHREFAERFDQAPEVGPGGVQFSVESYLSARGRDFVRQFTPLRFLTMSQSLDLHRINAAQVQCDTVMVAIDSDHLVPPEQVRATAQSLGRPGHYIELSSKYGHDAFLKEVHEVTALFHQHLHLCPA